MIKHAFYIDKGYPVFKLEDKFFMLQDLATRDIEEVRKIIANLESVITGTTESIDIEGYDTTIVECSRAGCIVYYDVGETKLGPLPTLSFLNLYKDWLAFLLDFEKSKNKGPGGK